MFGSASRIKLSQKMLAMVAVPLIFQFLFVVVFESLWQESRRERLALQKKIDLQDMELLARLEQFKKRERETHQIVAIMLGVSTALSIFLVMMFTHNIYSRLRILGANSERFADGKGLLPPVEGNGRDELSQVDAIFRDMTETVQKARERERQLLQMISHDLRTPLNTVLATLDCLQEGTYGPLSPAGMERIKQAEAAARRLIRLTNDLLDLEKFSFAPTEMPLQDSELQPIIEESIRSVSAFAEMKSVKIENNVRDIRILASPDRLVQVLVNILSNAIKYSPEGSEISIASSLVEPGFVEVRIADQGPGIPPAEQTNIFEPFAQVKGRESGGIGIGLAICQAIIKGHGGTIGVISTEGSGSTFWFRVRAAE